MSKKIILVVGPTGHGKSSLILNYVKQGVAAPKVGETIESETVETKAFECNVAGEDVLMYDTPGLGDTEKRDQRFLTELVTVLQDNCAGVHKVFFVMQVYEPKFNAFLAICLSLLFQLAPDLKQKPSILSVVLYKANVGSDAWDPQKLPQKIEQLKAKITNDFQTALEVIPAGRNNMQQFEQSVKNASLSVFSQTEFMVKVQTLDTKMKQAYDDLEKAKQENATAQQQIGQLQTACEQATSAVQAAQQQNAQDAAKITQLQGACDKATQEMQAAKQKYDADQQKLTQLQTTLDASNKETQAAKQEMANQIAQLKEQIANNKPQIQYVDGGGDGCVIL